MAELLGGAEFVCLAFLDLSPSASDEDHARAHRDTRGRLPCSLRQHGLAAVCVGVGAAGCRTDPSLSPEVRRAPHGWVAALAQPSSVTSLVAHADEALMTARRRSGVWINPHDLRALATEPARPSPTKPDPDAARVEEPAPGIAPIMRCSGHREVRSFGSSTVSSAEGARE